MGFGGFGGNHNFGSIFGSLQSDGLPNSAAGTRDIEGLPG